MNSKGNSVCFVLSFLFFKLYKSGYNFKTYKI